MKEVLDQARRGWSPGAADAARVRRAVERRARAPAPPSHRCHAPAPRSGSVDPAGRGFHGCRRGLGYWAGRQAERRQSLARPMPAPRATVPAAPPTPSSPALEPPGPATSAARPPITGAPTPPAVVRRAAASTPAESLAAEVRALRNIERALRDGNPGLATAFLDQLDWDVPDGQLREERAALRAIARCAARATTLRRQLGPGLRDRLIRPARIAPASTSPARTDSTGTGDRAKEAHAHGLTRPGPFHFRCSACSPVRAAATSTSATSQSLGGKLSDYAAEWHGYAEADTFKPSNSDHIHYPSTDRETERFRSAPTPLLPLPTDPNVGFPPGSCSTPDKPTPPSIRPAVFCIRYMPRRVRGDRIAVWSAS